METTTIGVTGMSCQGCVTSVTRLLKAVPGVDDASVTLTPAAAVVRYDAARTDPPALKAAIEEAGYGVAS